MTAVPDPPSLLPAALAWAEAGVCVLPAAPDGSKRPAVPSWRQYQEVRPDVVDLTAWLGGARPSFDGIGIVCGEVSGHLEMFELEAVAVADGMHLALRDLFHSAGFPELWDKLQTYVEMSPAGGLHWIYRVAGPVPGNTKLSRRRAAKTEANPTGIQVEMETRGEGGWVVCAPSAGRTHASGKAWQVLPGCRPGRIPTLAVDEHRTLHRLARTFDTVETVPPPAEPGYTGGTARQPGERAPGDDYNDRTDWADLLVPAGWTRVMQRGQTTYWRRPGKKVGISATTGYGDQGHDLLYVFTTSTEFESERSYSKFGAYAVLHCGGNFQTAGRALRQAGMGSPLERTNPLTLVHGDGNVTDETPLPPAPASAPDPAPSAEPPEDPPSWDPIDLTSILEGTYTPQVPELLRRADGKHLMYAGRVHSLHGESESGKSWVALYVAAEELKVGRRVAMVDFESDAHTTVGRLLRLGVPREAIAAGFEYRHPEVSPNGLAREFQSWSRLLASSYAVVILDGVTEALAIFGVTSKDNDEVTKWIQTTPRKVAIATGAAVVMVDHVTKDADSRGRFAIGGQAKMSALDGSAFVVEVLEPLGVGLVGRVALRVAKDRPGGVRPISGPYRKADHTQESCVVVVDSTVTDATTVRVEMPRVETLDTDPEGRQPFQPTGLMERVSRALENANACMARNAIASAVHGRREFVMQAIDILLTDGFLAADGPSLNGGRPSIRLVRPYRENGGGPVPDLDPTDLAPEDLSGTPTRSRSNDRGTRERVEVPSETRSRERVGTGRERVGPASPVADGDESPTDSRFAEGSEADGLFDLRTAGGNESGTGQSSDEEGSESS